MHLQKLIFLFLFSYLNSVIYSQQGAVISGGLETNANVFLKDSSIAAVGIPQYETQFFGGESWLNLNYTYGDFTAGLRYDYYLNSNLFNPKGSFTNNGIGRWFVKKKFDKLQIEVGNFYDQIGSGIIYRTYEQRPLFLDNSLLGVNLKYNFSDNIFIKGFGGRQRNPVDFNLYGGSVKGLASEGYFNLGSEESPLTITPGVGFVHKTISEEAMERVISSVKNYVDDDRFLPNYNSYATTLYNTLTYKGFSWYVETAFKGKDVYYNQFVTKKEIVGEPTFGRYVNAPGSVLYTSLSFTKGKFGISVEGKRTKNFNFRVDPNLRLLRGFISYIPPMNRQNTYRLTARYSPATQEISEQAFQAEARYTFSSKFSALANVSNINTIEGEELYKEYLLETSYKPSTKWNITSGLQAVLYNQAIYETKPNVDNVKTFTPYIDALYKFNRKTSLRTELQYMSTQQDFGSWLFVLTELGLAPHWLFEASAMFNTNPKKPNSLGKIEGAVYPTLGAVYISGTNRYQLRYVKQVEGIVCSGGICRLEPAFSGVRFSINSTF
jgi:hypothetical protein